MIGRVFNRVQLRILEHLIRGGEDSLSDITEAIGTSKPNVSKHLKDLADVGLVTEIKEKTSAGVIARYTLNQFTYFLSVNPSAGSVLSIESQSRFSLPFLLLEQVREEEFKNDLEKLLKALLPQSRKKDALVALILFGSVAEGKGTWKSDIDLAFIALQWTESSRKRIEGVVSDVNMDTTHQIKPQFFDKLQFVNSDSMLVKEIRESGIVIHCDIFERSEIWREMARYKNITR